jgi:hypothetical protein
LSQLTSITGMAGADAGDRLPCPSCGETVLQKTMIPVLGEDGTGMRYLCVDCARLLVVKTTQAEPGGPDADEGAAAEAAESGAGGETRLPPDDAAAPPGAAEAGAAGETEPRPSSEPAAAEPRTRPGGR